MLSIDRPDVTIEKTLARLAQGVLISIAVAAILCIVGWLIRIPLLQCLHFSNIPIPFTNAISYFLLALAGLCSCAADQKVRRISVSVLSACLIANTLLSLAPFAPPFGPEVNHRFASMLGVSGTINEMSPLTAACVVLLGLVVLYRQYSITNSTNAVVESFPLLSMFISETALIGWGYGTRALYTWPLFKQHMLLSTATIMLTLSVCFVLLQIGRGYMSILAKRSQGGYVARRLLPVTILLPVLISLMGGLTHYTEQDFLTLVVLFVVTLPFFVLWVSTSIHQLHLTTRISEWQRLQLQHFIEQSNDAIITVTPSGKILSWNNGAESIYGWSSKEQVGKNIRSLWSPEFQERASQIIDSSKDVVQAQSVHTTDNGDAIDVALTVSPIRSVDQVLEGFSVTIRDVTEAKKAQSIQTALRIAAAEEGERVRLARDLHDEIGQRLASAGFYVQSALSSSPENSAIHSELNKLSLALSELGQEIRRVTLELRPSVLDSVGLHAAIERYIDEWSERTGIASDVQWKGPSRLPSLMETMIYRVLQEALTNAFKHSRASQITVLVDIRSDRFLGVIADDGVGFGVLERARADALGLSGMQERLNLIGGELNIKSRIGDGTTVIVNVPILATQVTDNDQAPIITCR